MATPLDGYAQDASDLDAASLRVLFPDLPPAPVASAPVAGIPYPPAFVTVMGLVRAAAAAGEASPRALLLTAAAITRHNAADYSVWEYRRQVLARLAEGEGGGGRRASAASSRGEGSGPRGGGGGGGGGDGGGDGGGSGATTDAAALYAEELKFTFQVGIHHEKNYQVWHHRRVVAAAASTPDVEADYVAAFLSADPKNYHAWSHRQWAAAHWGVDPAGEVAFADALLADDVRNNSAWNHRHFALVRLRGLAAAEAAARVAGAGAAAGGGGGGGGAAGGGAVPPPPPPGGAGGDDGGDEARRLAAAAPGEVAYALGRLRQVKENASAWAYLLWWARVADPPTVEEVVGAVADLVVDAPSARLPPVMLGRLRALQEAGGG